MFQLGMHLCIHCAVTDSLYLVQYDDENVVGVCNSVLPGV